MTGLTEEEASIYDRQIRLWGLEAQQRLQSSRILVIGMRAVAAEVCKDLALAGVGALTIWDDAEVTEQDLGSNFLLRATDKGSQAAAAVIPRLALLNPRVELMAWTNKVIAPTAAQVGDFDVVCVTTGGAAFLRATAAACRDRHVKLFASAVHGIHGWIFVDLLTHEYLEEQTIPSKTVKGETETVRTSKRETYAPLSAIYQRAWSSLSARQLRRVNRLHFGLHAVRVFQDEHGRLPLPDDAQLLGDVWRQVATQLELPFDLLSEATLRELAEQASAELTPVAAIVGGVAAQEIVKAVSAKGAVLLNCFYYDGTTGTGDIETLLQE